MKLTIENIFTLELNQNVWIAKGFDIPDKFQFVGKLIDSDNWKYMILANSRKLISVYINNPKSCYELVNGTMFTTYEEACIEMKKMCLNTIDHYNKHQLKNNPIKVDLSEYKRTLVNINDI